MDAGLQVPPFRSLQDVLTDAQFTLPTLNEPERMSNRIIKNLLYYQMNYFLWSIAIFLLVGTLYPKDMIIGAVSVTAALVIYAKIAKICKEKEIIRPGENTHYQVTASVTGIVLLQIPVYMLGSVLVFLWGVAAPIAVIFLHASCRKRNFRNKFTNVKERFQENRSPMSSILAIICNEHDQASAVQMSRSK